MSILQPTILLIDDTPDHLEVVRRFLLSAGYRVVAAASGHEALASADVVMPDLIITALSLPGQLAWETARRLRARPQLSHTPILGTTVYGTLLPSSRVRDLGCADLIEKPFDFDNLLYHIGRLLPAPPAG